MHPFDRSGLGKPPYELVEVTYDPARCQHCRTAIKYKYQIKSGDGRRSYVGSDCIKKADERLHKVASRALKRLKDDMSMSDEDRAFYAGFRSLL